jgi:hypothetical protein
MPEKKEPKRRGRKAYKREPKLSHGELRWPEGRMRCPPEKRMPGSFKLNMSNSKYATAIERTKAMMKALFKRINIQEAHVTTAPFDTADAVNPFYPEPAVAIYYKWFGDEHFAACDRYNTIVGNLRACMENIDSTYKLTSKPWVHHDFEESLKAFHDHLEEDLVLFEQEIEKAPSKAHLSHKHDWQEVLEIPDDAINPLTGVPDRKLVTKQRLMLLQLYHPDHIDTCPDNGESWNVIDSAHKFVINCIDLQSKIPEDQARVKKKAKADAEERAAKRKQKQEEKAAAKAAAKAKKAEDAAKAKEKEMEEIKRFVDHTEGADDAEEAGKEPSGPSEEELRSIETDEPVTDDSDVDDSEGNLPDEEDFDQTKGSDESLFDPQDNEEEEDEDDDEKARAKIEERRRSRVNEMVESDG